MPLGVAPLAIGFWCAAFVAVPTLVAGGSPLPAESRGACLRMDHSEAVSALFRRFDANRDGFLDATEVFAGLHVRVARAIDLDGDGRLSQAEFLACFLHRHRAVLLPGSRNPFSEASAVCRSGRTTEAVRLFEAALKLAPLDGFPLAQVHLAFGLALLESGHPREAIDYLRRAVAAHRGQPRMGFALARAEAALGLRDDAWRSIVLAEENVERFVRGWSGGPRAGGLAASPGGDSEAEGQRRAEREQRRRDLIEQLVEQCSGIVRQRSYALGLQMSEWAASKGLDSASLRLRRVIALFGLERWREATAALRSALAAGDPPLPLRQLELRARLALGCGPGDGRELRQVLGWKPLNREGTRSREARGSAREEAAANSVQVEDDCPAWGTPQPAQSRMEPWLTTDPESRWSAQLLLLGVPGRRVPVR